MPKKAVKGAVQTGRPLGRILREARVKRALSLRDVERMTGIAVSQLSRTELGVRENPGFSTVARIASALGLSLDTVSALAGMSEGNTVDDGRLPDSARIANALETAYVNAQTTLDAIAASGYKATPARKRR
jgi:transcriptional regulator with XRE-family HTH domain